ncbi:hypothetical protein [Alkalihalobacillus pseudalcaliphilus]|uniref:hypothetical protein n=1 Tax=Alkalihalobacillus pseudalcaliphilus TaxID=79884 RepID=UPI00064D9980|nr:hypothetical protein [Alkalihalobacillus pseudalcaliphilus]KMK77512.1 hypothetical protein AB990_03315 [Alkalihalobacillus pseudalcaliphilus]
MNTGTHLGRKELRRLLNGGVHVRVRIIDKKKYIHRKAEFIHSAFLGSYKYFNKNAELFI